MSNNNGEILTSSHMDLLGKYLVSDCLSLNEFLDKYRRADRYTMRNGKDWGFDYSEKIKQSHSEELRLYGITSISPYESNTGETVSFKQ